MNHRLLAITILLTCNLFLFPIATLLNPESPTYIESLNELKYNRFNANDKKCSKYTQFECISKLHGVECIPSKGQCDGNYQCKDQSDERHCYLKYTKNFKATCKNSHGKYTPYAINDVFDNILDSGEISIAPNDYLKCNIQLNNITNLDIIKFTFEGVASYAQITSDNIVTSIYYLQTNEWIKLNSTYYDKESTQLNTIFRTKKNERGIYTNHIKFKISNIPPKLNKKYKYVKNEYLHIIGIRLYGNYMPFYCPTQLITKWSLFTKQYAEWKYIPTYKLCDGINDCIDGSDEIFCEKSKINHKIKVSIPNTFKTKTKTKSNATRYHNYYALAFIYCLLYFLL